VSCGCRRLRLAACKALSWALLTHSRSGTTAESMATLLSFEADRRVLNITLNSFGTSLSKEERARLFPTIGRLFPAGNNVLARADDVEQVKGVCEMIPEYRGFLGGEGTGAGAGETSAEGLEDKMFREETRRECAAGAQRGP